MIKRIFHITFFAIAYVGILAGSVSSSMVGIDHVIYDQDSTFVISDDFRGYIYGLPMEVEESEESNTQENKTEKSQKEKSLYSSCLGSSSHGIQDQYPTQKAKKYSYQKTLYKHSTTPKIYLSYHNLKMYC